MKKILCLALALMMALTAGLALAEEKAVPSKTNADIEGIETVDANGNPVTGVTVTATDTENPGVDALLADLGAAETAGNNPVEALPAEAQSLVEGDNFSEINEAVTLSATGAIEEGGKIYIVLDLQTNYTGKTIGVLLSKIVDGKPTDWKRVDANVTEDGKVRFELSQDILDWLDGHEMLALILNK